MNQLDAATRAKVIACLVEGNSIRATVRMTGVAKNTVAKLLVESGTACAMYQNEVLRDLACKRLQCDEMWSFCYAKDKNVPAARKSEFGYGSVWTWTAIDAETKLIASWLVGVRDAVAAGEFMRDLASRLRNRVQLTTDGHGAYLSAVEEAFGSEIDYVMLVKMYGENAEAEKRYSPAVCTGCQRQEISGKPDRKHISTSYVERQNLTMRMHMRRFTRLTNGFSKKTENHIAAISLHFMYYNFVRIHQTLRITPAMAAGVTERVWEISDIVTMLEGYQTVWAEQEKAASDERKERPYNPFGSALGHGRLSLNRVARRTPQISPERRNDIIVPMIRAIHKGVEIKIDLSTTKDGKWTGTAILAWRDGRSETLEPDKNRVFTVRESAKESALEDARSFIDSHP